MPNVNYQPRRRRPGCLLSLLLITAVVAAALWFLPAPPEHSILNAFVRRQGASAGEDEFPPLNEIWSEGSGTNKVVRIQLQGVISLGDSGQFFTPSGTTDMALRSIRRATKDSKVKAIIMEIDSGGGGITASDILYQALIDFKAASTQRKVVTICGDMAASGAYYVALASDYILAHPTTITGSIGVLIQSINIRELAERHGISDATFKSGENKDLLNPLGDISELEREILQGVVDDMHRRFSNLVAVRRQIDPQALVPLTDGRIFTAGNALELNLIDGIGYWQDAVSTTTGLLDVRDIIIYRYHESFSFSSLLRVFSSLHPKTWFGEPSARLQYRFSL